MVSPEQCDAVVEGRYKWSSIIYQPRALSPLTRWARRQYPDTSDLNAEKRPLYHKNSPRSYKSSSLLSSRSLHHFYHPSPLLYIITAIILYWKWEWTLLHIGQIVFESLRLQCYVDFQNRCIDCVWMQITRGANKPISNFSLIFKANIRVSIFVSA